jgi:hypothetical protein
VPKLQVQKWLKTISKKIAGVKAVRYGYVWKRNAVTEVMRQHLSQPDPKPFTFVTVSVNE